MITQSHFQVESEFTIENQEDFVRCFRSRDEKKLILPTGITFPMRIRSYFTWQESSGVYTYLVYKKPSWDMPRGMVFKRLHHSGEPTGGLCGWCHAYGSSDEIGTLSVSVNSNVSFAYILCQDLRCIEKIEESCARGGKNPENQIDQLYRRMGLFFENVANHKAE